MVTKSKAGQKKGKVEVGKLKLNKETVKDLTARDQRQIKGGRLSAFCTPPTKQDSGCPDCTAGTEVCPVLPR